VSAKDICFDVLESPTREQRELDLRHENAGAAGTSQAISRSDQSKVLNLLMDSGGVRHNITERTLDDRESLDRLGHTRILADVRVLMRCRSPRVSTSTSARQSSSSTKRSALRSRSPVDTSAGNCVHTAPVIARCSLAGRRRGAAAPHDAASKSSVPGRPATSRPSRASLGRTAAVPPLAADW
jgi:hypothetical protein